MIVSFNWLKDYVPLAMSHEELAQRLAMAGLNHEGTEAVGDDFAVDLEVTSNRPDCLGHLGAAREISVLWELPLTLPDPQPAAGAASVDELTSVDMQCPQLCSRYTARVIRGAKVGPSPDWLVRRLDTLGIAVINNVVDISNYVLMECGQPLHTFDFAKLAGGRIIVRQGRAGEQFEAIDHRTYTLTDQTCVIADAERAVGLGGVMGGADTEVSEATNDILIEAAEFAPLSIRAAARALKLHSPSSYRFERGVDGEGVDWASRRCCEMILNLAGGELAGGVIDVGAKREPHPPIVLRLSQLPRVLGIDVPTDAVRRILTALGNELLAADEETIRLQPPSWRRDLSREVDLIEEVARIHGYDKIPEDVGVRMAASYRRDDDRRDDKLRGVLTAAGYDEAMTPSVESRETAAAFSPWSDGSPLTTNAPMLRGADQVRMSLVPSLLTARQINQSLDNKRIELFEIANIYLPHVGGLPQERWMLGLTSGGGFTKTKGAIESLAAALNPKLQLEAAAADVPLLEADASCRLTLDGQLLGFVGEVTAAGLKQFGLRSPASVAEIRLDLLGAQAVHVPQFAPISAFPAIEQDMNFVVDEQVRWADLAATVRQVAGPLLNSIDYRETYRDAQTDGAGKKRLLFSVTLRSSEATLTGQQAEQVRARIVSACQANLGAAPLG